MLGLKRKEGAPQDWSLLWAACGTDSDSPISTTRRRRKNRSNRIIYSYDAAATVDRLRSRIANLGGCHARLLPMRPLWP